MDVAALADGVRAGSRAHVARAITLVESKRTDHRVAARELVSELVAAPGSTVGSGLRVGISGVPGAGKSTFIDAMGTRLVERGEKVAVVAVDPSSNRTGGSVLGDRTRMASLTSHENAFVRPSPSGNHLGGVARATRESMLVLEAAGFGVVIVETVGIGQSEADIKHLADVVYLVMSPGGGDDDVADGLAKSELSGPTSR